VAKKRVLVIASSVGVPCLVHRLARHQTQCLPSSSHEMLLVFQHEGLSLVLLATATPATSSGQTAHCQQ